MAEALNPPEQGTPVEAGEEALPPLELPPSGVEARRQSRLAGIQRRFGIAYFLLAIVVGIAVGSLIVLLGRSNTTTSSAWSAFKPSGHGLSAAQEIANHVADGYSVGNGPLAEALAAPPVVQQNVPITAAAIRTGFADERPQDVTFVRTNHSVVFQFRGIGKGGTIPGTPSIARGNLLRREILEMSLYSFKYLGDIDTVIAFPPPSVGSDGKAAARGVVLRRIDLANELGRPIAQTLPSRTLLTPGVRMTPAELAAVGRVRLMKYEFQALPDNTALLVLTPVA